MYVRVNNELYKSFSSFILIQNQLLIILFNDNKYTITRNINYIHNTGTFTFK